MAKNQNARCSPSNVNPCLEPSCEKFYHKQLLNSSAHRRNLYLDDFVNFFLSSLKIWNILFECKNGTEDLWIHFKKFLSNKKSFGWIVWNDRCCCVFDTDVTQYTLGQNRWFYKWENSWSCCSVSVNFHAPNIVTRKTILQFSWKSKFFLDDETSLE